MDHIIVPLAEKPEKHRKTFRDKVGDFSLTSRVKDSTTSDLESGRSFSSPISRKLFIGVSFGLILGFKSLATGRLSRFAISRLIDDLSSSTYIISMSLDMNLGNFLSYQVYSSNVLKIKK